MKVSLNLLRVFPAIAYSEIVTVALAGDKYEEIGTCIIKRDAQGNLYGILDVDRELDGNLFFYYMSVPYQPEVFEFTGIQLNVNERADSKTVRLKDVIIP